MNAIPRRLRKDPILEAVAEFRFKPAQSQSASAILPGLLFPKVRDRFPTLKALSTTQIPPSMRSADENLRYAPLYHLVGDKKILIIGDRSLAISVEAPYPGWSNFRELITSVWSQAADSGVIGDVERVSVKYVNLIEAARGTDHFNLTSVSVTLGEKRLTSEPTQIQTEIVEGPLTTLVSLVFQGIASNRKEGITIDGAVLAVDSILKGPHIDFWQKMGEYIDRVHSEEKRVFFKLLSAETLKRYEPEY
jgi:uncharacterized protein (TIGR04255 family)